MFRLTVYLTPRAMFTVPANLHVNKKKHKNSNWQLATVGLIKSCDLD